MFPCKFLCLLLWGTQKILSFIKGSSTDLPTADGPSHDVTNDFFSAGHICAIAAGEKSADTVCFVKILERHEENQKAKNFSVESICNKLAKQDTKHLFKK